MGGHDHLNTRSQPDERLLTPRRVAALRPAWKFDTGSLSGAKGVDLSDYNSTPVVAGGCLYIGAARGLLVALDADTGKVVWERKLTVTDPSSGIFIGSPVVSGGKLIALVSEEGDGQALGPYAVALDRRTGETIWRSPALTTQPDSYTHASPVVWGGAVLAGFSAWEGDPDGHGGIALIDERTGELLKVTYSIPPEDWIGADGEHFGGGGVWTTPAVDAAAGYAYFGTGNPYSKKTEHPNTNAILKLDVDRRRPTFGRLVASHKGDIEQFSELLRKASRPTCEAFPDHPLREHLEYDSRQEVLQGAVSNSFGCVQLDLDFGAAANLFRDDDGRLVVGDLQKSGVYHAVFADDLEPAWTSMLGVSCQVCNGASTAYDTRSRRLFAAASPGSILTGFDSGDGAVDWRWPIGDGVHYPPVSTAAGVVYTVSNLGTVVVNRASNGLPITQLPLFLDAGIDAISFGSSGVAIARRTVYAAAGSHVVAYRLP